MVANFKSFLRYCCCSSHKIHFLFDIFKKASKIIRILVFKRWLISFEVTFQLAITMAVLYTSFLHTKHTGFGKVGLPV